MTTWPQSGFLWKLSNEEQSRYLQEATTKELIPPIPAEGFEPVNLVSPRAPRTVRPM